jgi:hypothetical protein
MHKVSYTTTLAAARATCQALRELDNEQRELSSGSAPGIASMTQKVPMTVTGAANSARNCYELKTVARPRITAAIAEARAHGDLKENAEYHAAREQQSFAEGRIAEIESKLAGAQIIDVTTLPRRTRWCLAQPCR